MNLIFSDVCVDTSGGHTDIYGNGCEYYVNNQDHCGHFDNDVFKSGSVCCACGGGEMGGNITQNNTLHVTNLFYKI